MDHVCMGFLGYIVLIAQCGVVIKTVRLVPGKPGFESPFVL